MPRVLAFEEDPIAEIDRDCASMRATVEHLCDNHPDPFDCAEMFVNYSPRFDDFGIVVRDGGHSYVAVQYCPWYGVQGPESKRIGWFEELESLGFDEPLLADDIPEEYRSDALYRKSWAA